MSDPFAGLRRACADAVSDRVVPGLGVVVGAGGRTRFREAFGWRRLEPQPAPAAADTVWDLASLTKALVTSVLAMQAVGEGRLALADPLRPPAPSPSVRDALAHATGLPAHRPFWERLPPAALLHPGSARAALVGFSAAEPPIHPAGSRSVYSDLGFILLGDRLEQALGGRLDALASGRLFAPLELQATGFVDLAAPGPSWLAGRPVAASQRCPIRGRLLEGEVDDLNAWVMGGVAGHAGLFSTLDDLAALAHALCACWRTDGLVAREVLRVFWTPAGVPGSTWRLGWDGPAPTGSLAGARLSRDAVGHLAFTGCSLWIDPARETFVAILANRTHPTPLDDPRFRALRPALNDAALAGLGY